MPTISAILKSIQHPTRRQILEIINDSPVPVAYSSLLYLCENSTGKLNYHLRTLNDIIIKSDSGYTLSDKGSKILVWLENIIAVADPPSQERPTIVFSRIYPDKAFRKKYVLITTILALVLAIPISIVNFTFLFIPLIVYLTLIVFIKYYYNSIWYQITDTEVTVHKGIITKTLKIVPYRTITNLEMKRGILDRNFSIGTLDIQTAGITKKGVEEKLVGLIDIEEIRETIVERIRLLNPPTVTNSIRYLTHSLDQENLIQIENELKGLNKQLRIKN